MISSRSSVDSDAGKAVAKSVKSLSAPAFQPSSIFSGGFDTGSKTFLTLDPDVKTIHHYKLKTFKTAGNNQYFSLARFFQDVKGNLNLFIFNANTVSVPKLFR